jgi:hypothetical protein
MSTYEHGQWDADCDQCGFTYKARQLRLQWNNLRTCSGPGTNECWEPRHPQEFVRGKKDQQAPPWVRPEGPEITLAVNEVTPEDL